MKYNNTENVVLANGTSGTINDGYESPTSGEIIYEVLNIDDEFVLIRQDDIPEQE